MARKGTSKGFSLDQENHIASLFEGKRSPSSGAAVTDQGDVRIQGSRFRPGLLIECKTVELDKETPTKPKRPAWLKHFEKVTEEAWAEGREPMMAFRFFDPASILADQNGWIDLTVRIAQDDSAREREYDAEIR